MRKFLASVLTAGLILASTGVASAAPTRVSSNLIYSWWTHPIATESEGSTYFGGVTATGSWRVFKKTGDTVTNKILQTGLEADDHNAPSQLVKAGKPNLAFYTRHGKSSIVNYWRAPAGTIDYVDQGNLTFTGKVTYSQVLNEGDKVVVLTRTDNCVWRYKVSEDYGLTWSTQRTLIDACEVDNKIYVLTADSLNEPLVIYPHPSETEWRDIVYGEVDVSSGEITSTEGTVGDLDTGDSIEKEDLDSVAPTQTVDQRVRLLDTGQLDGKPVIWYAKWGSNFGPRYYSAVQQADGSFDRTYLGITAGTSFWSNGPTGTNYVGGIAYDSTNEVAYIASNNGAVWDLEQYQVNASGTVDTPVLVTSDPDYQLVRPYVVKNSGDLIYQRLISYSKFTIYDSQIWFEDM